MALLPAMSHWFGLHPPAIYDLTPDELQPYLETLEQIREAKSGG